MRILDKDLISLITLLVKRPFSTLFDIMTESNASKRQIMYRIDKINDILKYESLPLIQLDSNKNLSLIKNSKDFLIHTLFDLNDNIVYYFNKNERHIYMYVMMFMNTEYLSLQHFINILKISKSTALQDLKELSQVLLEAQIQLRNNRHRGYYICGDEMTIRRFMIHFVIDYIALERNTKVFDELIKDFDLGDYSEVKAVIKEITMKYQISFVEDRLQEFIYIYIFLKSRIIEGNMTLKTIPHIHDDLMKTFKEYQFAKDLINYYQYNMKDEEIKYISAWVLGISVGDVDEKSDDSLLICEIVGKIMSRFEFLSGVHYYDTEEIFNQLYSHFRPAYYRLIFNLPIYNPFKEKIKEEYKELFLLVKEAIKPLDVLLGWDIPDDELAYLTIHFASIYTRNKENKTMKNKSALIICTNGIGSSAILYSNLKNIFPEINFLLPIEASKYDCEKYKVDIVFTTQFFKKLNNTNIPIVKVSPIMNIKERFEIERQVYSHIGSPLSKQPNIDNIIQVLKKHVGLINDEPLLKDELMNVLTMHQYQDEQYLYKKKTYHLLDMVNENLIKLNIEAEDWIESIKKSGEPLLNEGKIKKLYIDTIIQSPKKTISYTVIAPSVVLAHTLPEKGAIKCALGISSLKIPVKFGNKENDPVKYIFFLSALDNESHLPAMNELLNFLNNPAFFQAIDNAKTSKDVMEFIRGFS